jgi:hypothetical protein
LRLAHKTTDNQMKDAKTKKHCGDSNEPGELESQLQQNLTIPQSCESLKQSANRKWKKKKRVASLHLKLLCMASTKSVHETVSLR